MGFARVAEGKNMLGVEDHVAWVTPGTFTVDNVPCSEDGSMCGGEEQHHHMSRKFVSQTYVDPSVELIAKKANDAKSSLRVKA